MERTRQERGPEPAPAAGPGDAASSRPSQPGAGAEPVLALEGIHKQFPGVIALRDAAFDVRAGEVHALLGENGAGKSTLMAVASGSLAPDAGTIAVGGERVERLTPQEARRHGIALVHQHPALLPDMTVAENIRLALPERLAAEGGRARTWMRRELDRVGFTPRLETRVEDLSVAQRHLLELMKGLAIDPVVLILDEPTAALGSDRVEELFAQVRAATARGTAVVYISHRLPEVRAIADRVTVMRDGEVRGSAAIDDISDDEMLRMIIGRSISAAFPPKAAAVADGDAARDPVLTVEGLSGDAFAGVDLRVAPGEIVGVAGIAGNGQAELLRALAGLERASGTVRVGARQLRLGRSRAAREAGVVYLSPDRHGEGLVMDFSVRENAALSALGQLARGGVVNRRDEDRRVDEQRGALNIRTASRETAVGTLSGGNQQKVVLARALLAQPAVILADEPTQGVDAGARVEIYRILREAAARGVAVVVASSDVLELEGLCDRVVVFSRGQVVSELAGDDVDEERITRAILTATAHRAGEPTASAAQRERTGARERLAHFAKGDYAPAVILLVAIVVLGAYTYGVNDRVLSTFNLDSLFILLTALAFISLGQLVVMFTGGIDISVGPLAGFVVVISSFFLVDGKSTGAAVLGLALMLGAAVVVGLINGSLVRFARFTPIAATLAMYIALQGISLVLRPEQDGYIRTSVIDAVQTKVGPVPLAFLVVVVVAIALELALRRRRWGLALRAVGSDEPAARTLGVRSTPTVIGAYVLCSVLTFLGGIMLMAQIGVGDPAQGVSYTLSSITAVVLGGASLLGGRGSFVAALCGAALIQQITNATTFLSLSQAWQYWFVGGLTLLAAGVYTRARGLGRRA